MFLLDEIDKTGASYHGDPSAALLEVLDPEQNNSFEDHYLGLPYDLSRVLFICTANSVDSIPLPLLDRMEVVYLSGYSLAEKMAIATKHLLPEIFKQLKLAPDQLKFTDEALKKVIEAHTREAGVRSLKRQLENITRKTIRTLLEEEVGQDGDVVHDDKEVAPSVEVRVDENIHPVAGEDIVPDKFTVAETDTEEKTKTYRNISYDVDNIRELLGRDRYSRDIKENTGIPGVAIGLAWTPVGGDILYIEAAAYPGKGELKLSGKLGDVMKESALAALSFIKKHSHELDIPASTLEKRDIHIHIPSGAIPKDGPSAGVALISALTSLLTGRPIAENLAMTGEISLRGRILPVGGIKEKVLAARSSGISTVLLPEKNRPEFEEIPTHITEGLQVEYYTSMMDLLKRTVPQSIPKTNRDGW